MSAGRSASGSTPIWLIRVSRRGEPDASTNLGRPMIIAVQLPVRKICYRKPRVSTTDLFIAAGMPAEPTLDALGQLIAHLPVGGEPLLARAFHRGWIGCRPIFDIGCDGA